MRKLIPILILVVLLSGCKTSKDEYFADLFSDQKMIVNLIENVIAKLADSDESDRRVILNNCDSLINVARRISDLKPPKEEEEFHELVESCCLEYENWAENIKLYIEKKDVRYFEVAHEHLGDAEVMFSEMLKHRTERQR